MSKYTVQVTITAKTSYTVEIDTDTEANAETIASSQWRERLPEDFQVEKGYITGWETEAEQLTAECPECGKEHAVTHDNLRVCHCGQFGHNPYLDAGKSKPYLRPHLVVDGVCTPETWWHEDPDYCFECGVKLEAQYRSEFPSE